MTVVCTVRLYEGAWQRLPSEEAVTLALERHITVVKVEFVDPDEDVALQAEVSVRTRWCHAEIIRDQIGEFLLCFEPEYESMIEVEVEEPPCP